MLLIEYETSHLIKVGFRHYRDVQVFAVRKDKNEFRADA